MKNGNKRRGAHCNLLFSIAHTLGTAKALRGGNAALSVGVELQHFL